MLKICLYICCWVLIQPLVAQNYTPELFPIKIDYKWGFMDKQGNVRVPAIYDNVDNFNNWGLSIVRQQNRLGIMDSQGRLLIDCQYELIQMLDKDLLLVRNQRNWELRNLQNKLVLEHASGHIELLKNGYMIYERVSGKGLAHINRGIITPANYANFQLSNLPNRIIVEDNLGQKGLIDSMGQNILPIAFSAIQCFPQCLLAQRAEKWGLFSASGDSLLPISWDFIKLLNHNFIELQQAGNKQLYALSAGRIVLTEYQQASIFLTDKILFRNKENRAGVLDSLGQSILAAKYNDIQGFSNLLYRVQTVDASKWGLVNRYDSLVLPATFDYIGSLNSSIATICKEGKSGVVNYAGKITLDIIHPPFTLDQNSVKIRDAKKGLIVLLFNEEGELEEQSNYGNFKSLKVQSIAIETNNNRSANKDIRKREQLNDSLFWVVGGNGKYGVFNTRSNKFLSVPKYDSYTNYPEFKFTLVEIRGREKGGMMSLDYIETSINTVYGIISNEVGLPITKMELIHLNMNDLTRDSLDIARCIFVGGAYGLINKKGQIVLNGMAFIDDFVEGKARCTKKGTLGIDVKGKHPRNLGPAIPYLDGLMCNYAFDGIAGRIDPKLAKAVLFCADAEWGFMDTSGDWVIADGKYDFVEQFSNDRAMVQKDNKWGLIDENGKIVLPLEYGDLNYIPNSDKKLFYSSQSQQRFGCINSDAKVVVPVHYDKVRQFSDGMVAVSLGGRWGFANEAGEEIIPCKYSAVRDFKEGYAAVSEKGRWGFIDKTGKMAIKAKYNLVGQFQEGLAWVQLTAGQIAYIDYSGQTVLEGKYTQAHAFEEGIARVRVANAGYGLIDRQGNWVAKPQKKYRYIGEFNQYGLAMVKIAQRYALLNRKGKIVSKGRYSQINNFNEGYAAVRRHGYGSSFLPKNVKYGIIDSLGQMVCPPKFTQLGNFHNGLAAFRGEKGWGFVYPNGKIAIEPNYLKVNDFKAGRAVVYRKHDESGLIDTNGRYIVAPNVDKIIDVTEELALVKASYGSYYFLHEDLQRHTPYNFQAAYSFHNGVAPIRSANQWGVINHQGLMMMTPKYSHIDAFHNGFARVKLYTVHGVVNIKGEIVIPPHYEHVSYSGNGLFRVEQGNQIGYLNVDGQWVWKMQE